MAIANDQLNGRVTHFYEGDMVVINAYTTDLNEADLLCKAWHKEIIETLRFETNPQREEDEDPIYDYLCYIEADWAPQYNAGKPYKPKPEEDADGS